MSVSIQSLGLDRLSIEERLTLIDQLWDSIEASNAKAPPVQFTEAQRAEIERRGLRASAVFPVRCQKEVCAVLNVYASEPGFFQDKEIALLVEAA